MDLARDHLAADGPRVVLLHAGVADRRVWRDVAPALHERGADVLAYDRRGFGETPWTDKPFRHVDDLLGLLGEPAWLAGNSMGGALALEAALLAPEKVAGLVLIAPAVSGAPDPPVETLDADTARLVHAIMAADEAGDLEAVNRHEIHLWLDGPSSPEGRVGGGARELALDMNMVACARVRPRTPAAAASTRGRDWRRSGRRRRSSGATSTSPTSPSPAASWSAGSATCGRRSSCTASRTFRRWSGRPSSRRSSRTPSGPDC